MEARSTLSTLSSGWPVAGKGRSPSGASAMGRWCKCCTGRQTVITWSLSARTVATWRWPRIQPAGLLWAGFSRGLGAGHALSRGRLAGGADLPRPYRGGFWADLQSRWKLPCDVWNQGRGSHHSPLARVTASPVRATVLVREWPHIAYYSIRALDLVKAHTSGVAFRKGDPPLPNGLSMRANTRFALRALPNGPSMRRTRGSPLRALCFGVIETFDWPWSWFDRSRGMPNGC